MTNPTSSDWTTSPEHPGQLRLARDEIHLWRSFLDSERSLTRRLEAELAGDEVARASRFVFPRDRDRFVSGRGVLRDILARYLGRMAAAIEFTYEPAGKPRLRLRDGDPPIHFNLSHSHGLAVFAVSNDREIGVDVEAIRGDVAGDEIAERFFSAKELAELRFLPPDKRDEGFFLCWSRKEVVAEGRDWELRLWDWTSED